MAQDKQSDDIDVAKWKLGAKCSLFNREDYNWNDGTIVGSFSDENGEWIKVQCGSEIHDVRAVDPDLRVINHDDADILTQKVKELKAIARRRPDMASKIEQTITMSNELRFALLQSTDSLVLFVQSIDYQTDNHSHVYHGGQTPGRGLIYSVVYRRSYSRRCPL